MLIILYWGGKYVSDFYLSDVLEVLVSIYLYFMFVFVVEFVEDNWKGCIGWVYYVVMVDYVDFVNI